MPDPMDAATTVGRAPRGDGETAARGLRHEIAVVLAAKALALAILYLAFFSPAERPVVTPATMGTTLTAPASPAGAR